MILAHNYMTPEIFHGVGDYVGDSLGLAKEAAQSEARGDRPGRRPLHGRDLQDPVARTRRVLIPDLRAGCCLAASITGADVRLIKQRYPGVPVVTYVNTTAEVKAETDICCTSANAVQVVEEAAARVGDRPRHPDPRRVPGPQRRPPDGRQDHRLAGPLRGARALHRRRHPGAQAPPIRTPRCWPTRNARPRCSRSSDFAGSTAGDERLCADAQAQAGGADHRMLHGRQRRRPTRRTPSSCAPATSART